MAIPGASPKSVWLSPSVGGGAAPGMGDCVAAITDEIADGSDGRYRASDSDAGVIGCPGTCDRCMPVALAGSGGDGPCVPGGVAPGRTDIAPLHRARAARRIPDRRR